MPLGDLVLNPEDPFDKIVFLEHSLQQEGFNNGFESGKQSGQIEGFHTGLVYGKELGKEIGFYKGFVSCYCELLNEQTASKRQLSLLKQLSELLDEINYENAEDEGLDDKMAKIRTKFKQLSSILKVPVNINKDPALLSF